MPILAILILISFNCFASKPKILIINSYHAGFEWVDDYTQAIKENLENKYDISSFDMNTKRILPSQVNSAALKAIEHYDKVNPALVFLGDDLALSTVGPQLLNRNAKIVFLGINNNPRHYFSAADLLKISGVLEQPLIQRSISILKEILPKKIKSISLQYDTCPSSEFVINKEFGEDKSLVVNNVLTELNQVSSYKQWQSAIESSKANGYDALFSAFYYCLFDDNQEHVDHNQVIKWSSLNSHVPIFAFWDFAVGKGKAIGGYVISGLEMGLEAARLAQSILESNESTPVRKIVSVKKGSFLFSRFELKRWGISLPDSILKKSKFVD